jgi:hypothetical protein
MKIRGAGGRLGRWGHLSRNALLCVGLLSAAYSHIFGGDIHEKSS